MQDSQSFTGIIPYLVTPLDQQERVNSAQLQRLCRSLIEQGVHGLTPLGSTGECAYLSQADRLTVVEAVVEACEHQVPVVPGVTAMSVKAAIEQAQAFERAGAEGIVLTLDSYFPLSQDDIKQFFLRVAESTDLPIIIYTNPNFQKVDLGIPLLIELSHNPSFVGLKDASTNTGRLLSLSLECAPDFGIYAASAHIAVSVMLLGGKGLFAGPACVLAREYVMLYELCQSKRWDEAMDLQKLLWRFNEVFAAYNMAACVKAALLFQGFEVGEVIAPQASLSKETHQRIGRILQEIQSSAGTI